MIINPLTFFITLSKSIKLINYLIHLFIICIVCLFIIALNLAEKSASEIFKGGRRWGPGAATRLRKRMAQTDAWALALYATLHALRLRLNPRVAHRMKTFVNLPLWTY